MKEVKRQGLTLIEICKRYPEQVASGIEAHHDDPNHICVPLSKLEKIMKKYAAIPNDWRHFFDDLKERC